VTDVALTIGLVAAATGAVLAIVADTSTSGVSVTPSVSPDHAAIVVGGQF
jgi:F0F1-type ATP synthase membrane subunit c/vacuolar-type H+-ATPase subunit K